MPTISRYIKNSVLCSHPCRFFGSPALGTRSKTKPGSIVHHYHLSWPLVGPKKNVIFNSEREALFLFNLLRNETPQLSLVKGPVNSGKSMLMRHVIKNLTNDSKDTNILQVRMRELPFVSIVTFVTNFKMREF